MHGLFPYKAWSGHPRAHFRFNVDSIVGLTKAMFELVSKKMDVPVMDDHTSMYTSLLTSSHLKDRLSSIYCTSSGPNHGY